jgi:hypothetical protein
MSAPVKPGLQSLKTPQTCVYPLQAHYETVAHVTRSFLLVGFGLVGCEGRLMHILPSLSPFSKLASNFFSFGVCMYVCVVPSRIFEIVTFSFFRRTFSSTRA